MSILYELGIRYTWCKKALKITSEHGFQSLVGITEKESKETALEINNWKAINALISLTSRSYEGSATYSRSSDVI